MSDVIESTKISQQIYDVAEAALLAGKSKFWAREVKATIPWGFEEILVEHIAGAIAAERARARLAAIERIENFALGAEGAGHRERAQAARDVIKMLQMADCVFDGALAAPSDTPSSGGEG